MSVHIVKDAVEGFEAAAHALLAPTAGQDESTHAKTRDFIDGCRYACTANLDWRYVIARCVPCHSPSVLGRDL